MSTLGPTVNNTLLPHRDALDAARAHIDSLEQELKKLREPLQPLPADQASLTDKLCHLLLFSPDLWKGSLVKRWNASNAHYEDPRPCWVFNNWLALWYGALGHYSVFHVGRTHDDSRHYESINGPKVRVGWWKSRKLRRLCNELNNQQLMRSLRQAELDFGVTNHERAY